MVRKLLNALGRCEETATVFLMWSAFLIVLAHIICRYVFKYPLYFAEEVSRYAFIYVIMIGSSVVLRDRAHTRVEYFVNFLPSRGQHLVDCLTGLFTIFFLGYLIFFGIFLARKTMNIPTAALSWSWGLIYLAAPIGGILMLVSAIGQTFDDLKKTISHAKEDKE